MIDRNKWHNIKIVILSYTLCTIVKYSKTLFSNLYTDVHLCQWMNDILWTCCPEKMNPQWKWYMCYLSEFRQSAVLGTFYFYFLNSIESNYLIPFWLLICGDSAMPVWQGQYHGCWCLGSLRRQVISPHDIDYVEWLGLPWQRISSTCAISVWGMIEIVNISLWFCWKIKHIKG